MKHATFSQADGIPLYVKLASLFRHLIDQGEWEIGKQIPPLPVLQESYGVARATVRQAIGILQEEGYLSSQRGRGTYVLRSPQPPRSTQGEPGHDELTLDPRFRIEVLGHFDWPRTRALADLIPEAEGPLVNARKRHLFKEEPYSIVDFIMPRRFFDMIPPGLDEKLLYAQLVRDHTDMGPVGGEQVMTVNLAGHEAANLLRIPLASPLVQLESVLSRAGDAAPVMAHRSLVRADLFLQRRRIDDLYGREVADWRPTARNDEETGEP